MQSTHRVTCPIDHRGHRCSPVRTRTRAEPGSMILAPSLACYVPSRTQARELA
jgi:hypothetical protein